MLKQTDETDRRNRPGVVVGNVWCVGAAMVSLAACTTMYALSIRSWWNACSPSGRTWVTRVSFKWYLWNGASDACQTGWS